MNRHIFFPLIFIVAACNSQDTLLEKTGTLPARLKEISGVESVAGSPYYWTLADAGNPAEIYAVDSSGRIIRTVRVSGVRNNDWEDLTSDIEGNLYIGDFGNNDNDRRSLAIYKINASDLNGPKANVAEKIAFYYPEQQDFPPKKSGLIYDVEAFFIANGNFYLFTKNRSTKSAGTTMLYKVPNTSGQHAANLIGKFQTCIDFHHCAITSADISPDGQRVALLSGAYVWLFTNFTSDSYFAGSVRQIDLNHFSQKEGLCFSDNNTLIITDERKKKSGGNIYILDLAKLKPESQSK